MQIVSLFNKSFNILSKNGPSYFIYSVMKFIRKRLLWINLCLWVEYRNLLNKIKYDSVADPYKIIYVDPSDINKAMNTRPWGGRAESYGRIEDGGWDKETVSITELEKYRAVKKHFCENIPWEETGIIDHLYNRLQTEDRDKIDGCKNKEDLKRRYRGIDRLFESIQQDGFKLKSRDSICDPRDYEVLEVHIDRNGNFIFVGTGYHRMAIVKILNIEKIPVRVETRHRQWQLIREEIYHSCSEDRLSENAKKHLGHPDLDDIN